MLERLKEIIAECPDRKKDMIDVVGKKSFESLTTRDVAKVGRRGRKPVDEEKKRRPLLLVSLSLQFLVGALDEETSESNERHFVGQ